MTEIAKAPGIAAFATETFTEAELFSGDAPIITETETLLDQNAALNAYTVLGRISASNKLTVCNSGASDGSEDPVAILAHPVSDTGADQSVAVYAAGMFNPDRLTWHASFTTAAQKKLAFKAANPMIFIKAIG